MDALHHFSKIKRSLDLAKTCSSMLVLACLASACSEGIPTAPIPPAETRGDQFRPPDPATDPNAPLPFDDLDLGEPDPDMGGDDMSPAPGDMDNQPGDMDEPDLDPSCEPTICTPGETLCDGEMLLLTCVVGGSGCPEWDTGQACPGNARCIQDRCDDGTMCTDLDNDGYGEGCLNGPDCDDGNPDRHSDKVEVCDGIDNDCNNIVDDGVMGVGTPCSSGEGLCEAAGSQVCNANGELVCDAIPGTPMTETCDGRDEDCDGVVDNGACMTNCSDDPQEPNETLATAFALSLDSPVWGFTCGADREFYSLAVTSGVVHRVYLSFPHANANLDLKLYEDGIEVFATTSSTDHEGIQFTPQAGSTYAVEVANPSGLDNFYRLNLVDDWDCDFDDTFENNNTISTSTLLPAGWRTDAYMCLGSQDWYFLGQHPAGTLLSVDLYFSTGFFGGGDLDMALYGDQDGDNTYDIITTAASGGDDEFLTHTTTWQGNYFLRVYGYLDSEENDYEIRWSD